MKRVLVTGAGGFIGRHLCRALVPQHEVWALTLQTPRPPDAPRELHWITHDLTAPWPTGMPDRCDAVIHLAQSPDYRTFPARAVDMFKVNCLGLQHVLDFAARAEVKLFVYVSTGGIYGAGPRPFKEASPFKADGALKHYFTTKFIGELLLNDYAASFTPVVLRPFFVHGVGQKREMLVPRLIRRIATGEPITLHGKQGIRLNPVHVSDMVAATIRALHRAKPLTANIAGPEVLTLRQMAERIGKALGTSPKFDIIESARPPHLIGDIDRMTRELVPPKVRFGDAIDEICRDVIQR